MMVPGSPQIPPAHQAMLDALEKGDFNITKIQKSILYDIKGILLEKEGVLTLLKRYGEQNPEKKLADITAKWWKKQPQFPESQIPQKAQDAWDATMKKPWVTQKVESKMGTVQDLISEGKKVAAERKGPPPTQAAPVPKAQVQAQEKKAEKLRAPEKKAPEKKEKPPGGI